MTQDLSALRKHLADQWQKLALDLIGTGVPPEAVFESMLTVGLAGHTELHGKEFSAGKLIAIAEQLSEQVRQENMALRESSGATKN